MDFLSFEEQKHVYIMKTGVVLLIVVCMYDVFVSSPKVDGHQVL